MTGRVFAEDHREIYEDSNAKFLFFTGLIVRRGGRLKVNQSGGNPNYHGNCTNRGSAPLNIGSLIWISDRWQSCNRPGIALGFPERYLPRLDSIRITGVPPQTQVLQEEMTDLFDLMRRVTE